FKKEAIEFAWEYTTNYLAFSKDQIWISIFENDDEAFDLWHKRIGVPANRIVRLGKADNFWGPAGDKGACGPCSELYLDRGIEFGPEDRQPGDAGDRFMEFWNLVFNQFNYNGREFLPLNPTGIDTGAGLERLGTLVQNVDSVYDTDELKGLRDQVSQVFNAPYNDENRTPIRVITDHIRTLVFAMADGIFPSNESRGYVLRRVLRRALLFGRKMGQDRALMHQLVPKVESIYGSFYPELKTALPTIEQYVKQEEIRFLQTLDAGANKLEEVFARLKSGDFKASVLPGKEVFILYDTYGFPPEMTQELAEQNGAGIDWQGFRQEMEKQRERGRAAFKGRPRDLPVDKSLSTEFTGYLVLEDEGKVISIIQNDQPASRLSEDSVENSYIILDRTPFYAESGGQMGDAGLVIWDGGSAEIIDTQKFENVFLHVVGKAEGLLEVGVNARLVVDKLRRSQLAVHHSATHLLNAALREKFGAHIKQSGSLVHPDYLRFDFTHPAAVSQQEIQELEKAVNSVTSHSQSVNTQVMQKQEAEKTGAVMTFGEKYGDVVRVVSMGNSVEFCGGTHVSDVSEIGVFIIAKEGSPGAGNRRIEAHAGKSALEVISATLAETESSLIELQAQAAGEKTILKKSQDWLSDLKKFSQIENLNHDKKLDLWQKLRDLKEQVEDLHREIKKLARKKEKSQEPVLQSSEVDSYLASMNNSGNLQILQVLFTDKDMNDLRQIGDIFKAREPDCIYFFGSQQGEKFQCTVLTTRSYQESKQLDLNKSLKDVFSEKTWNGKGGGKAEMVSVNFSDFDVNQFDLFVKKYLEALAK
ncbi:MAG: alanine--tRNA ligase, partial [Leptospiraceae bacterium]|nr:alanine--tRNA ligase [Leptospiraceae bacterium]